MKCSNCDKDYKVKDCMWCERPICVVCTKMYITHGRGQDTLYVCPDCVQIESSFDLKKKEIRLLYKKSITHVDEEIRQRCYDRWYKKLSQKKEGDNNK